MFVNSLETSSGIRDVLVDGGVTMFRPKGYYTSNGYVGFLPDGSRMSFPTQDEYEEYVREWDVTEAA